MPEVIVTISRDPRDPTKCIISPDPFRASHNDTITFRRVGIPEVVIHFKNGSPFGKNDFPSGSHKAITKGRFDYEVNWVDAGVKSSGGGQGEVGG